MINFTQKKKKFNIYVMSNISPATYNVQREIVCMYYSTRYIYVQHILNVKMFYVYVGTTHMKWEIFFPFYRCDGWKNGWFYVGKCIESLVRANVCNVKWMYGVEKNNKLIIIYVILCIPLYRNEPNKHPPVQLCVSNSSRKDKILVSVCKLC